MVAKALENIIEVILDIIENILVWRLVLHFLFEGKLNFNGHVSSYDLIN